MDFYLLPAQELLRFAVSQALGEIWDGKSQFGPLSTGAVNTSFLRSSKAWSHFSVQMKSTFPVSAYEGALI